MKTYIKFVNSVYKDMNMKDLTFDDKEWDFVIHDWGVKLTRIKSNEDWERLHIPWNNIVVMHQYPS